MIRLNKKLVSIGYCSRRNADKLIESGRVYVNGKAAILGQIINDDDKIMIDGDIISNDDEKIILAYNKPKGVICTESKVEKQTKISDLIKDFGIDKRLFTVGRLDKDTTGLIIITNDGELSKKITDTKNNYEKEYEVLVNKEINDEFVKSLEKGVYIEDLDRTTLPAKVKIDKKNKKRFNITITQGLNRQVRRMCRALGYHVYQLNRIRIMKLKLNGLKIGEYRYITKKEIGI